MTSLYLCICITDDWVYIETALDGGRVLTLEPDNHHVWMAHKYGSDDQLWRLEDNGCIRSKSYQDKCLGLETHTNGGQPYLQTDQGVKEQQWYYIDKYLVNQVTRLTMQCIEQSQCRLRPGRRRAALSG